ncbi:hypothetical protein BDD12DRAFT_803905 [Trichophaea hybrida]|nr:hypothetical protein BDD12DRAFT_803905 [Trichophaea hybrida]
MLSLSAEILETILIPCLCMSRSCLNTHPTSKHYTRLRLNIAKEPRLNHLVKTYQFNISCLKSHGNDQSNLSESHAEFLPMLPNLRNIGLVTDYDSLSSYPYDTDPKRQTWGRKVLIGIIEALYQRTQTTGVSAVTEFGVSSLDLCTMSLSPQIIEKAIKGMASLQGVQLMLSVKQMNDRWVFLVGTLLGTMKGLRRMRVGCSINFYMSVGLWSLLVPSEQYLRHSLKIKDITTSMIRQWNVLTYVEFFGIIAWSNLLLSFFEKHKSTLRAFRLDGCHLIDGYDDCLDDLHRAQGDQQVASIWYEFFKSFKARFAPLKLEMLEFRRLATGITSHINRDKLAMHNGEAKLWVEWIMMRKPSMPLPYEIPASGCPAPCCCRECEEKTGAYRGPNRRL